MTMTKHEAQAAPMKASLPISADDKLTRNALWRNLKRPENIARILAFAEGYAMMRYPRSMVFVKTIKELEQEFEYIGHAKNRKVVAK